MTLSPEDKAEIVQDLMIALQLEKWNPPKEFFKRQDYERAFSRHLVERLARSGWEFRKVTRNTWTRQAS